MDLIITVDRIATEIVKIALIYLMIWFKIDSEIGLFDKMLGQLMITFLLILFCRAIRDG